MKNNSIKKLNKIKSNIYFSNFIKLTLFFLPKLYIILISYIIWSKICVKKLKLKLKNHY